MVRDGNDDDDDIYKINIKEHLDIKKIVILILMIVVVIGLSMVAKKSIEIMNQHKVYKQYEAQLATLKKQEEDKQVKQEEIKKEQERIRQERTPKLTQERKKQYGKHISFRNQKSIFNLR